MYFVCKLAPLDTSIQQLWVFGLLFCTWSAFFLLLHNLPPESRDQLHPFRSLSKQERKQWSNVITEWTQKLSERQKLRS